MSVSSSQTPHSERLSSSRVPGGFDTDNELDGSDIEEIQHSTQLSTHHDDSSFLPLPSHTTDPAADHNHGSYRRNAGLTSGEPVQDELLSQIEETKDAGANDTVLEEAEMKRRLGEFESSFIPELSHLSIQSNQDTEVRSKDSLSDSAPYDRGLLYGNKSSNKQPSVLVSSVDESTDSLFATNFPHTPPAQYRTPAPEQQEERNGKSIDVQDFSPDGPSTSRLEVMSSSPTAARTVSRVQSMATIGGYETADDQDFPDSPTKKLPYKMEDLDATPKKSDPLRVSQTSNNTAICQTDNGFGTMGSGSQSQRPKYLNSRSAASRLSYDSITSSTTDTSDATLGADFALQSGGAAPETRSQRTPRMTLSRSTSLGSMISGVSNFSDDENAGKRRIMAGEPDLTTLKEESPSHSHIQSPTPDPAMFITPKPSSMNLIVPSETVITNHVRDLEVPGSFARQYRKTQNVVVSPQMSLGSATMTPGTKKGLTLKEHRSTVEKLGKENFDLKMKIHFLDQALQRRSEDGVKEMITENVQLKSDRMRLEKENHGLRKQVRDLQKQIKTGTGEKEEDQGYATDEERKSPTAEEELMYLRERVETNEIEISKLRKDRIERESEKRKLAEMVRSLGERGGTGSEVGNREERDMWKDMLETETIAREQSEEECKRLKDEIAKLRQGTFGQNNRSRKTRAGGSVVSRSSSIERASVVRSENGEIERLRHEISELQKMIGAQASTLTSRNKEKERLYQEIEDLKLGRMGGLRSVAGDSILDRSASRARSNSRASNGTRFSRLSEPERDQLEIKIGELRDEVSQLKLTNQNLQNQFEEALLELDAVDAQAQADADQFNEELALLTQERDNALREAEEQDDAFQQLKTEAQEEIDGLGDELDAKVEDCERLEQELGAQAENINALQAEMRSASEGLVRLEEDAQQNLARYQAVQVELDDAHRELVTLEKNLHETESEIQRLSVQQESSHNEIAFLREEADGDKIKIGDLESLLKKVHLNLDSERDRAKDLDRRLSEERHQREAVSNQEKQEVQRMLNDLNREITTTKDELRKVKKTLSSREIEVTTHKERLIELEESLRHILGDSNATRSTLVTTVSKMQREKDHAIIELEQTRQKLDEHQNLLSSRNALLESSSLEYRKLTEALERERQARRQDKHSFEQSLKSHQQSARALTANNTRIAELEQQRTTHRKQIGQIEVQFKDQLAERNQVLLNLWKKLSVLCGPDWAHNHSLINGNLPSQEVVGNVLFWPGFSRNLLMAAKQLEDTLVSMKDKIKMVDRELSRDYHHLEQMLEDRTRKLERIEEGWEKMKLKQQEIEAGILSPAHPHHRGSSRNQHSNQQASTPDVQKIKAENRLLKAELQLLQRQQSTKNPAEGSLTRTHSHTSGLSLGGYSNDGAMSLDGAAPLSNGGIPARSTSMHRSGVSRANSAGTVDQSAVIRSQDLQMGSVTKSHRKASPDRPSLAVQAQPHVDPQYSTNGHFPRPSISNNAQQSTNMPIASNSSDAGTITTAALLGMGQERWIHRLRELERRLKAEREQRLIDRSGMRKRLEEREAVNESLRKELERERVRRSWAEDDDDARNTEEHPTSARGRDPSMGRISLNNRYIEVGGGGGAIISEVEGSPVRSAGTGGERVR